MVNLYKDDDYNKPKVDPAGASNVGGVSPAPTPAPTKEPVPVGQNSSNESEPPKPGLEIEKGPEKSPEAETITIDDINYKIINNIPLTPEEQKLFEEINQVHETAEKNAEQTIRETTEKKEQIPPEVKQKMGEYKDLENQGGTEYEKTSRVLDKYLSENDEKYQALKEKLANTKDKKQRFLIEKQLQAQRDKIIHDWQAVVNPDTKNENLSLKDRQRGIHEIRKIFMYAGANGITGEKQLDELKKSQIISDIKSGKIEIHIISKAIDDIEITKNEKGQIDSDKIIHQFAENLLKHDKTYQSLTGEAKEEYLQNKMASTISDQLGIKISKDDLQNNKRIGFLKQIMAQMIYKFKESGNNVEEILSNPDNIKSFFTANQTEIKKQINSIPDEETRKDALRLITHIKIAKTLKNSHATELDVYEYLKTNANTEEDKELLKSLEDIHKVNPALLKDEINPFNAVGMSIILGEDIKQITDRKYEYTQSAATLEEKCKRTRDAIDNGYFKNASHSGDIEHGFIEKFAQDNFKGNIKAALKALNLDINKIQDKQEISLNKGDISSVAGYTAIIDSTPDELISPKQIERQKEFGKKIENGIILGQISSDKRVVEARKSNPESITWQATNEGFIQIHGTKEFAKATDYVAEHTDKAYTGLFSKNGILACKFDPEVQNELSKELLKLHKAAVTAGVAAAEQHVDASIKDEYSKNLTNEINKGVKEGYYTKEDAQNFQTSRQTGQTSYEREMTTQSSGAETKTAGSNSAAQTSSSSKSSSSRQSSTASASSSYSTYPEGTKVTTGTIYVSSESKTYARELKTTLAAISQLNSEAKKAEALKKIAESIAKIQKEAIKYEEKAEQKKITELQKAEEIKKENEKKTEEELKAELSSALEAEVTAVEEEISTSPEATEVQKQELINELRSYARAGQMDQVFAKLSQIPKAQEKFLEKLATKHISTISHFIKGADKSILKFMCEKNPGIISTLDTNTLMVLCDSGFPKSMIIKFGDKNQVAAMFKDFQSTEGGRRTLGEFYEVMGVTDDKDKSNASDIVKKNDNDLIPGSDKWYALFGSNTVGNSKFKDGKTRMDIKPRNLWT